MYAPRCFPSDLPIRFSTWAPDTAIGHGALMLGRGLHAGPLLLRDGQARSRLSRRASAPRRPRAAAGHPAEPADGVRRRERGVPRPLGPPRVQRRGVRQPARPIPTSTSTCGGSPGTATRWPASPPSASTTEENRVLGLSRGWLDRISVRRPWRHRGLASALILLACSGLRERGIAEGALGVDADNPHGALGLYESLGFVQVQRATTWRKPLEPGED